jgi:hypothetical protein
MIVCKQVRPGGKDLGGGLANHLRRRAVQETLRRRIDIHYAVQGVKHYDGIGHLVD